MNRNLFVALGLAVLVTPVAAAAADAGRMSAAQIVDRNVAARGGLAAWRAVNTLTMSGELDAGGKKETCLLYTSPSPRDATLSRMPSSA